MTDNSPRLRPDVASALTPNAAHAPDPAAAAAEPPRVCRPDRPPFRLEPVCLDERPPPDPPARSLWAAIGKQDLASFYDAIQARGSGPGRSALAPRLTQAAIAAADRREADPQARVASEFGTSRPPASLPGRRLCCKQTASGNGGALYCEIRSQTLRSR